MRDRLIPVSDREARLDEARATYGRNDWMVARSRLLDADAQEPLEAEDLERLAWSCRWVSDEVGFLNALERAEVAFSAAGARAAAARMVLEQARQHVQMLDESVVRERYESGLRALKPRFEQYARANLVNRFPLLADLVIWRARKSPRVLRRISGVLNETSNPGNLVTMKGIVRLFTE